MGLKIGNIELKNRIVLAPMAGVTDLPMRVLCHEMGAGLVCMEMVSAQGIAYNNSKTMEMLRTDESEHPVSLQLFGKSPEILGDIVARIDDLPVDIIDFNMGCPVPKVVKNGEGSALMNDPHLAADIVKAMVRSSSKPVTVKIRRGFDDEHVNAVEVARYLEDAGASAIAVHGRTREQYYSGKAHWDIIRQVKEAVSVPVIGNGDIDSALKAEQMLKETGCDGIMVGRGARGNPWLFRQIDRYLEDGIIEPRPDLYEVRDMILRHARMMVETKGEYIAMRQMRSHVSWYVAGYHNAAALRREACRVSTYEELNDILKDIV